MGDVFEYTLKEPIVIETLENGQETRKTIDVVKLRTRMIARDLRAMDSHPGEIGKAIAVIAQLSGLPMLTVELFGAEDFMALMQITEGFTPPGQTIGLKP